MNLQQQMSLFQEGGLEQDGNTIDPVSGNDVPVGSSQEEVRDDIPAQLSEGEFVFPADVVRYLGLEFLMNLRQRAKAGLARMEEMGQMGNSEEATIPDDVPFTVDDLDMEDEPQEFDEGGSVEGITQGGFRRVPEIGINPPPQDNIAQDEQATFMNAPTQQTPTDDTGTDFESLLGSSPETYDELRKYVGPNGEISYIAFKGGKPLPAYEDKLKKLTEQGFIYEDPATVGEEETDPTDTSVETAQVRDREGDSTDPMNMRKAEQERIQSFKSAIESVMKETGITDPAEAAQYIKDGNHKIKGIPIPGFLFKDFNLFDGKVDASGIARPATYGLDQAAEDVFREQYSDTGTLDAMGGFDALGNTTNLQVATPSASGNTTNLKVAAPSSTTVPSSAAVPANQQSASSINTPAEVAPITTEADVEKARTGEGVLTPREQKIKEKTYAVTDKMQNLVDPKTGKLVRRVKGTQLTPKEIIDVEQKAIEDQQKLARKQLAAKQQRDSIRDADRAARDKQQKELDKDTREKIAETRRTGRITGFKEGGIASKKPKKKKVMKRGGLASKKK